MRGLSENRLLEVRCQRTEQGGWTGLEGENLLGQVEIVNL